MERVHKANLLVILACVLTMSVRSCHMECQRGQSKDAVCYGQR